MIEYMEYMVYSGCILSTPRIHAEYTEYIEYIEYIEYTR